LQTQLRLVTESAHAVLSHIGQPRISDLMRGKIGMFSIDTLVAMLAAAGIEIDIRVSPTRVRIRRSSFHL
jgi:predicted XRE-type DNA-binding protein